MGLKFSYLREAAQENKSKVMERSSSSQAGSTSNNAGYEVSLLLDINGNGKCIVNSDKRLSNLCNSEENERVDDVTNSTDLENDSSNSCTINDMKSESNKQQIADSKSVKCKVTKKKSHKLFFPNSSIKKKNHWVLRFSCARLKGGNWSRSQPSTSSGVHNTCICTGYKKTETYIPTTADEDDLSLVPLLQHQDDDDESEEYSEYADSSKATQKIEPVIDLSKFNPDDYPIEDCDERARIERAREIAEGVEPPPGFNSDHHIELVCPTDLSLDNLTALFRSALSLSTLSQIDTPRPVHTQIDYIHCLVPDLLQITSCSFYWGKIDRYEAERLLDSKPEGTFLLRDSAQEEYLFSVSFRKYGRSLHARIEQWNHRFSFDSHDPGVFASPTICGLIEHYKDPTCCMFFEPMLTIPLHRNYPFTLQHLCRAVICNNVTYDSINLLKLPKSLKSYLKEYHYKQRVRVRKFETDA